MKHDNTNDLNDKAFPLAERHIKEFAKKVVGPSLILCHPSWEPELTRLSVQYNFSVYEWDEQKSEAIFSKIIAYKVVVIAFPTGEDELAALVADRLKQMNLNIEVLRLLRDVFLQITLHLGGPIKSQDKWKMCGNDSPSYFIFAIPRSGSTFFSDVLGKTLILGHPREHLLFDLIPVFFNTDFTFNDWIRAMTFYSFTPNGFSGTKIISHLFLDITYQYKAKPELIEDLSRFFREYPIIYLKRLNKVRQAISLIKAKKSSVWHIKNDIIIARNDQDQMPEVNPKEIENSLIWIYEQEQRIEEFFRKAGIEPKTYYYEDFTDESMKPVIFRDVTGYLKIENKNDFPEANYSILSDEYNEEVVRNYFAHIEKQMRGSFNIPEPLNSSIMASMAAEISMIFKKQAYTKNQDKPKRIRFWKFLVIL